MPLEELANRVFNDKLLRDRILGYMIHSGNEISTANVRSCRLINTAWLQSTSRCLHTSRRPLFHLHLDNSNSINGTTFVSEHGKLLDKFVNAVAGGGSRLHEQVPTFKIKAECEFFRHENYQSLLECFNQCGRSLVELNMKLPRDGGSMTFLFPNLSLPKLQNCAVDFYGMTTAALAHQERTTGGTNYIYLLQQIFSGSKELQLLNLWTSSDKYLPYCLEQLVLPTTIKQLDLSFCGLESKHLELLTRNSLPNLKKLNLAYFGKPLENGLIYKILENVQRTLIHFSALDTYTDSPPVGKTNFLLPEMMELEVFESKTELLELELNESNIENKLPKLRKLCLENQTEEMFRKWTDNSKLTSVVELVISMGAGMVQYVNLAFPNLQTLEITVCGTELSGLKCVFENIKRLRILRVNVTGTGPGQDRGIGSSDCWDALLLGIPIELAKMLTTKKFWDKIDFNDKVTDSIKELTELQELTIRTLGAVGPYLEQYSLISDAAFKFAFSKMAHLNRLVLGGRFMVSAEAKQEWEDMGRVVIYSES